MSPPYPTPLSLAFYDGRRFGTWLDRRVAAHDRGADAGPFSHVELVFSREIGETSCCFSSSFRDKRVRFRRIDLERPAGQWALVAVPATPTDAAKIRRWCATKLGGRYDLPGVLAFKLPLVRQRLNWWFCSEICAAALQQVGLLTTYRPATLTPNMLFHVARRAFVPLVPREVTP